MKIWVNKAKSFKEAEQFDSAYYASMSGAQRVETVQFLRELYRKMKGSIRHEGGKRLRRVAKVI
jgi:hypothetical protein